MKKISTKNILKKIFKGKAEKTVKKKVSKKVSKKISKRIAKTKKVLKEKKSVSSKIKKVLKKNNLKSSKIKKNIKSKDLSVDTKVDNLRISKANEIKPEIKKVRKQDTEKKEYKIKDYVVYPKHGVGQITEIKKINYIYRSIKSKNRSFS